jgi:hypothetical protein
MYTKSEGFWRWCVIICKIVILEIFDRLNYKIIKLQRFGSWILLPGLLQVPGGPTDGFLSSPPFLTWKREQNPASETLWFYYFII